MKALPIVLLFLFSISSCTETENLINTTDQSTVNDDALAESTFEEIDDLAYSAVTNDGGRITGDNRFECATITKVENTITIDFGDECTDPQGRVRSGKIIVSRTGPYFQKDATITTTLEDFTINGHAVEGTRVIKNLGTNENDHYAFEISLTDGHITFTDGTELSRSSSFIRTWVRGANVMLDELHITGAASGINRKGVDYEMTITDALVYKVACRHEGFPIAVQGVKELTANEKELAVDFGDGTCDNVVTITAGAFSKTIELDI